MDQSSPNRTIQTGSKQEKYAPFLLLICLLLLLLPLVSSCDPSTPSSPKNGTQSRTFTGSSTQPITYSISAQDVLIRTFYGGGLYGSLSLSPQISIYGDGSYILGQDQQGQLTTEALQQLLNALVNTYGLLNFSRQRFSDIQDENATFLELAFNGKQEELAYGTLNSAGASAQDLDEYHRLEKAITTINETLKGPTHPYKATAVSLLVRQTFSHDLQKRVPDWPLSDFTLAQAAVYECGVVPADETSQNAETACLKFVIPSHAILLNRVQVASIQKALRGSAQGDFRDRDSNVAGSEQADLYYTVILRPLLPDELARKMLAMFGSEQEIFRGVPLLSDRVPPVPSPTAT